MTTKAMTREEAVRQMLVQMTEDELAACVRAAGERLVDEWAREVLLDEAGRTLAG